MKSVKARGVSSVASKPNPTSHQSLEICQPRQRRQYPFHHPSLLSFHSQGCLALEWTSGRQNGRRRDQHEIEIEHVERRCCHYNQAGSASRHEIMDLDFGREYRFRIRGVNEVGKGDWSYPLTMCMPLCVPNQLMKPIVVSMEETGVRCAWLQPEIVGGRQALQYQMEIICATSNMLEGCMHTWQTVYLGSDCECFIKHLVPGCDYSVRVKAQNEVGWGLPSPSLHFRTSPSLPHKPLVPHAVERYDRSMRIYWIPPAHDGGHLIQQYRLQICPTDRLNDLEDENPFSDVYQGNRNSTMIDALQPGRVYALRVQAINSIGSGPWSDLGYESTPAGSPMPPRNLKAVHRDADALKLTWNIPESDGGAVVDRYQLELTKAHSRATIVDDTCPFTSVYEGPELEYVSRGLTPSTVYWMRVRSFNDRGCSDWSPVLETETTSGCPSVPEGLETSAVGCTSMHLSWHPLPPETRAIIEVSQCDAPWIERYNGPSNSCHINELQPGQSTHIRIKAVNHYGYSSYSDVLTVETEIDPPEVPQSLTVVQSTATVARLKWTMPTSSSRPVRYYRLEVKGSDGMLFETRVQGTVFRLNDLTPETSYEFRLAAVNELGSSPWSPPTVMTTKAVPPSPPYDLKTLISEASVEVTWSADHSVSLEFEVEAYVHGPKKNKHLQPIAQSTVSDRRCTLTGLDRNQKYEIRVRSIADGSIGKWSTSAIVKIPEAVTRPKETPVVDEKEIDASPRNRTKKAKGTVVSRCKNPPRRRKSLKKFLKSHLPLFMIFVALLFYLALILHK